MLINTRSRYCHMDHFCLFHVFQFVLPWILHINEPQFLWSSEQNCYRVLTRPFLPDR